MYRFRSGDRVEFHHIVDAAFPQLLAIANGLVQETSLEAWEMLHTTMKAFKHAIYVGASLKLLRSVKMADRSRSLNYHLNSCSKTRWWAGAPFS